MRSDLWQNTILRDVQISGEKKTSGAGADETVPGLASEAPVNAKPNAQAV